MANYIQRSVSSPPLVPRGGSSAGRTRRERIDPILWAPALLVIIAALIALTALLFSGRLRSVVPLTLVSDRAGLVMEEGAKVKFRGVQIGEVGAIGAQSTADGTQARLALKIDPGPFRYLPANVDAEIKSSTAFGAKYVDLIPPDASPSIRVHRFFEDAQVQAHISCLSEGLFRRDHPQCVPGAVPCHLFSPELWKPHLGHLHAVL